MKKKTAETLKILAFVALGLLLAWLSLRNIPTETLWANFRAVNPYWLALAVLIAVLSHLIRALRWNMLLQPAGYRVKPLNAFMAVMSAYFINLALPRTGEVARCGLVNRYDRVPLNVAVGTVVAERVVDMLVLLLLFVATFLVGYGKLSRYMQEKILAPLLQKVSPLMLLLAGAACVLLLVAGLWYLRRKRKTAAEGKKGIVEGFLDGLKSVLTVRKPLSFILSSLGIWVCYYLMLYVGFQAHPATRGLGWDAGLSVFVFGTVGMIVTPGGIGAYPALVGQTLTLYGIDETAGVSFGWIIWGAQTLLFIVAGPLSLIGFPVLNRQNTISHDEG